MRRAVHCNKNKTDDFISTKMHSKFIITSYNSTKIPKRVPLSFETARKQFISEIKAIIYKNIFRRVRKQFLEILYLNEFSVA